MRNRGTPLPPYPLKALLGAGFAKSVGKILISKILEVKILRTNALVRRDLVSGDRHGLDHDRAIQIGVTRSDVTMPLWRTTRPMALATKRVQVCV